MQKDMNDAFRIRFLNRHGCPAHKQMPVYIPAAPSLLQSACSRRYGQLLCIPVEVPRQCYSFCLRVWRIETPMHTVYSLLIFSFSSKPFLHVIYTLELAGDNAVMLASRSFRRCLHIWLRVAIVCRSSSTCFVQLTMSLVEPPPFMSLATLH